MCIEKIQETTKCRNNGDGTHIIEWQSIPTARNTAADTQSTIGTNSLKSALCHKTQIHTCNFIKELLHLYRITFTYYKLL